jgi:osmotically-inducible protein OsmY
MPASQSADQDLTVAKAPQTDRLTAILERVESRLLGHPYLALKNISCEYREGVLTLRGCLPSYYLKQVAQTAVAHIDGVGTIINLIDVVPNVREASHD